ncbi:MAG: hypothetical protein AAGA46_03210 [Cyanobacteria bacterium P01_F01_bin.13]
MLILSNRNVYLFGKPIEDGVFAIAIWLKEKAIAGTSQELWIRGEGVTYGFVNIPLQTTQVHTDILLPYVTTMETKARVQED